MRILITGAAGFLGSHLSDRLLAEGHEIVGLDNFITGNPQNIAHLMGNERFSFYKHDVSNYIFVQGKVDAVLHFASPASPNPQSPSGYFNLPIQTMKAGALGTHNCLGVAKGNQARFLLASTSEIYGDPLVHPQTEEYTGNVDPAGPRAVYDEAKRFAESITMAYHRYHGVDSRIVRIFNTYGPRQTARAVIPTIASQLVAGRTTLRLGALSPTRDFNFVTDTAAGMLALALCKNAEGEVVNIGSGEEWSIERTVELLCEIAGRQVDVVSDEARIRPEKSEVNRLLADNHKIGTLTGWGSQVSFRDGLTRTMEWISRNLRHFDVDQYAK